MDLNRGGRPRKVTFEELKEIAFDYFLFVINGKTEYLSKKGIYTALADYAHKSGKNYTATDFSRCANLKQYLTELSEQSLNTVEEGELPTPGYTPLDIEYCLRPDVYVQKRKELLQERDAYYQQLHIRAAKAIEAYNEQYCEIKQLRQKLIAGNEQSKDGNERTQSLERENRELRTENRYLKRYIREYVEPEIAEAVLTGNQSDLLTVKAASAVPPKGKEPATATLMNFISQNVEDGQDDDDIGNIIKKIKNQI